MLPDTTTLPPPITVAHSNQVQIATLMAAHFTATRASVDDWLRRRDQYLMIFITGAGAILSFYLSHLQAPLILAVVPVLTLVVLFAYLSADLHVAYLCRWLKVEYTAILEKFVQEHGVVSLAPWHWDNSESLTKFYSDGIARWRYHFLALTLLLPNAAASLLPHLLGFGAPPMILVSCTAAWIISCCLLISVYRKRRSMV